MTKNRYPTSGRRHDITGPHSRAVLHERYVRAINSALQDGRETVAQELADAYEDDLRTSGHQLEAA